MNPYIIKKPVVTEKSIDLARSGNVYTFEVDRTATKDQIKDSVEKLYGVDVMSINTVTSHRTHKATGRKRLKTVIAPTKKALVTLKKGQTIDLFDFDKQG